MRIGLYKNYSLLLSGYNETQISSTEFRKILKYQISRKPLQWEPNCSMQTEGHTDMTKLKGAFRNFANAYINL